MIAPSCYSCFDYMNGLADLVVGYMGVPYEQVPMTQHHQQVTIRNAKGQQMFDLVQPNLSMRPVVTHGNRKTFVMQTVFARGEIHQCHDATVARKTLGPALDSIGTERTGICPVFD